jgi:predicted secreted protein
MAIGKQLSDGNPDGTGLGQSVTDKISLYGVTPIAQRSGAAQATSLVGTASSADVTTAMKAAVIEIMDTLVAIGAWKGSE